MSRRILGYGRWGLSGSRVTVRRKTRAGRLELMEARVKGSGAGMEPPPGAVLRDGWWHYRPAHSVMEKVALTRSTYTKDYELCWEDRCRMLTELLGPSPGEGVTVELFVCRAKRE